MKTEKKKTLRGSALFTVVAVMAILILFLTGTLMLATASNRRAHKSYSVSQASYTARSAIRSFKAALEDPTNGPGIAAALHSLNPNDPDDLFRADITVSNDVPYISWQPDLRTNDPSRVYQVLCAPTPSASAQEWVEWLGPGDSGASTNRFFKVELDWEESYKKK